MKKALSLAMAVLMIALLFSAASAEDVYTYTMAQYNAGPIDDDPIVVKMVNEKYGVNFEMVYIEESSRTEKLNLLATDDDLPDVIYGGNTQLLYEQGMIGTWTEEFFREHCPNIAAMIDQYAPDCWNVVKYDGEMYAIPGVRYVNTIPDVVAWNGEWLEKLGVTEIPDTLEGVEELFYRIAKEDPDGNGQDDTYALSQSGMRTIFGAFGFEREMWMDDGEGGVIYGDVMPQAKECLELLAKWYKDGVLDPEFITGENQGGSWSLTHAFINQRIGMSSHGNFYHWTDTTPLGIEYRGTIAAAIAQTEHPFQVVFSAPPIGPHGDRGTRGYSPLVTRNTFNTKLVENEARFARLLEIIDDIMMNVENCKLISCGVEGLSYNMVDLGNGVEAIQYTPEFPNNASRGAIGADGWFNFNNFCMEFQKLTNAQNTLFAETYLKDYKDMVYVPKTLGTLPSNSLYATECDKILNEGYIAIITGEKPVDYFEEMVAAWNAAGGKVLTEEANAIFKAE